MLETIRPDELLDFFIELAEIERDEMLWEMYVSNPFNDMAFDEYKKKATKSTNKPMKQTQQEEQEAIARAEAILNITEFRQIEE